MTIFEKKKKSQVHDLKILPYLTKKNKLNTEKARKNQQSRQEWKSMKQKPGKPQEHQ